MRLALGTAVCAIAAAAAATSDIAAAAAAVTCGSDGMPPMRQLLVAEYIDATVAAALSCGCAYVAAQRMLTLLSAGAPASGGGVLFPHFVANLPPATAAIPTFPADPAWWNGSAIGVSGLPAPPQHASAVLAIFGALYNATATNGCGCQPPDGRGLAQPCSSDSVGVSAAISFLAAAVNPLTAWHTYLASTSSWQGTGLLVAAAPQSTIYTETWASPTLRIAAATAVAASPAVSWLGYASSVVVDGVQRPCLPIVGALPPWIAQWPLPGADEQAFVSSWCIAACAAACAYDDGCISRNGCPTLAWAGLADNIAWAQAQLDLGLIQQWLANTAGSHTPMPFVPYASLLPGSPAATQPSRRRVRAPHAQPPRLLDASATLASIITQLCDGNVAAGLAGWCYDAVVGVGPVAAANRSSWWGSSDPLLLLGVAAAPTEAASLSSATAGLLSAAQSAVFAAALSNGLLSSPSAPSAVRTPTQPQANASLLGAGAWDVRRQARLVAALNAAAAATWSGGGGSGRGGALATYIMDQTAGVLSAGWASGAAADSNRSRLVAAYSSALADAATALPLSNTSAAVDWAVAAPIVLALLPPSTPAAVPVLFQGAAYMLTVMAVELAVALGAGVLCVVLGARTVAALRRENAGIIAANKRAGANRSRRANSSDSGDASGTGGGRDTVRGDVREPLLPGGSAMPPGGPAPAAGETAAAAVSAAIAGEGARASVSGSLNNGGISGRTDDRRRSGAETGRAGAPATPTIVAPGAVAEPRTELLSPRSAISSAVSGARDADDESTGDVGAALIGGVVGVGRLAVRGVGAVLHAPVAAWSWLVGDAGGGDADSPRSVAGSDTTPVAGEAAARRTAVVRGEVAAALVPSPPATTSAALAAASGSRRAWR